MTTGEKDVAYLTLGSSPTKDYQAMYENLSIQITINVLL